jgi:hypothetical protein
MAAAVILKLIYASVSVTFELGILFLVCIPIFIKIGW